MAEVTDELHPKKRLRYSREPDLDVEIDGETINICSYVLIMASDVFAQMLEAGMRESEEGKIRLEGKSKEEFKELLTHLDVRRGAAPPPVNNQNVEMLLRWADEYQIDGLTERCESFLLGPQSYEWMQPDKIVPTLKLAAEFRLDRLQQKCALGIAKDIHRHRHDVPQFFSQPAIMECLYPALFAAAGLPRPDPLSGGEAGPGVQDLWPLACKAIEVMHAWQDSKELEFFAMNAKNIREEILKVIPLALRPEDMNTEKIKKRVGARASDALVEFALERLRETGRIRKLPSGMWVKYL